ncbi:hypothetical protein [Muriicola sp.]|uniref:hypothetical protein n=1 Tax=Muriicola sp. TaxID=2020856 RepID=UPI003C71376D
MGTTITYKVRFELVLKANELFNKDIKYAVIWPKEDINYFWVNNALKFGLTVNIFPTVKAGKIWLLNS